MIVYVSECVTYMCYAGDIAPHHPPLPHLSPHAVSEFCHQHADRDDAIAIKHTTTTTTRRRTTLSQAREAAETLHSNNSGKDGNCTHEDGVGTSKKLSGQLDTPYARLAGQSVVLILPISSTPAYRAEVVFMLTHTRIQVSRVLVVSDTMADSLACGMTDGLVIHLSPSRSVLARVAEGSTTRYVVTRAGAPHADDNAEKLRDGRLWPTSADIHSAQSSLPKDDGCRREDTSCAETTNVPTKETEREESMIDAAHAPLVGGDVRRHSASDRRTIRRLLARVTRGESYPLVLTGEALAMAGVRARWLHVLRACGLKSATVKKCEEEEDEEKVCVRQRRGRFSSSSPSSSYNCSETVSSGSSSSSRSSSSTQRNDVEHKNTKESNQKEAEHVAIKADTGNESEEECTSRQSAEGKYTHSGLSRRRHEVKRRKREMVTDDDDGDNGSSARTRASRASQTPSSSVSSESEETTSTSSDAATSSSTSVNGHGLLVMQPILPLTHDALVGYHLLSGARNGISNTPGVGGNVLLHSSRVAAGAASSSERSRASRTRAAAVSSVSRRGDGVCGPDEGAPDDCCRWLSLVGGSVIGLLPQNETRMMWLAAAEVQRTRGTAVHWKCIW